MKIKMYWPNCQLYFNNISFNGEDAFFLECSLEEARKQVFTRLTEKDIKQCMHDYDPKPREIEFGFESDKICFLITKDQKSLLPEPSWFPFSGQWNAYCPFRRIKEIELKDLSEITSIVVELEEGDNYGD